MRNPLTVRIRNCRSDCLSCPKWIYDTEFMSSTIDRKYFVLGVRKYENYKIIFTFWCVCPVVTNMSMKVLYVSHKRMKIHRTTKSDYTIFINLFPNVYLMLNFQFRYLKKKRRKKLIKLFYWWENTRIPPTAEILLDQKPQMLKTFRLNERTKFMPSCTKTVSAKSRIWQKVLWIEIHIMQIISCQIMTLFFNRYFH